jgi:hypothetical protein
VHNAKHRLHATRPTYLEPLRSELARILNRPGSPEVDITATERSLTFDCRTWEPILVTRVEDAMDELLGNAWRAGFRPDRSRL